MNETLYNHLREESWRRALTEEEQAQVAAYLAAHPQARVNWEEDQRLGHFLAQMPEAPRVSSNFTSLVIEKARLETAAESRSEAAGMGVSFWKFVQGWLPRTAAVALVIGLAVTGYQKHENARREILAEDVALVSEAVTADPQVMEDFDSIRQMGRADDKADVNLLAVMQ